MMQKPKPKRRIVTKKAYVKKIGSKTTLTFFGVGIFLFGVVCALFALLFAVIGLFNFSLAALPVLLMMIGLFGGGSAVLLYFGGRTVKEAKEIDAGVPLTRTNIRDLPITESLVRASSEPVQVLQSVLLRAATSADTTPAEQLVRAYQEPIREDQTAVLQPEPQTLLTTTASAETELVEQRLGAIPLK